MAVEWEKRKEWNGNLMGETELPLKSQTLPQSPQISPSPSLNLTLADNSKSKSREQTRVIQAWVIGVCDVWILRVIAVGEGFLGVGLWRRANHGVWFGVKLSCGGFGEYSRGSCPVAACEIRNQNSTTLYGFPVAVSSSLSRSKTLEVPLVRKSWSPRLPAADRGSSEMKSISESYATKCRFEIVCGIWSVLLVDCSSLCVWTKRVAKLEASRMVGGGVLAVRGVMFEFVRSLCEFSGVVTRGESSVVVGSSKFEFWFWFQLGVWGSFDVLPTVIGRSVRDWFSNSFAVLVRGKKLLEEHFVGLLMFVELLFVDVSCDEIGTNKECLISMLPSHLHKLPSTGYSFGWFAKLRVAELFELLVFAWELVQAQFVKGISAYCGVLGVPAGLMSLCLVRERRSWSMWMSMVHLELEQGGMEGMTTCTVQQLLVWHDWLPVMSKTLAADSSTGMKIGPLSSSLSPPPSPSPSPQIRRRHRLRFRFAILSSISPQVQHSCLCSLLSFILSMAIPPFSLNFSPKSPKSIPKIVDPDLRCIRRTVGRRLSVKKTMPAKRGKGAERKKTNFPRVDKGFVAQVADVVVGRTTPMNDEQRERAEKTVVGEFSEVKHVRGILSMGRLSVKKTMPAKRGKGAERRKTN
ncbi:hypothetical protein Droror1_Dr00014039 [Drosera rotundifolia]